jgi:hypothetical protein
MQMSMSIIYILLVGRFGLATGSVPHSIQITQRDLHANTGGATRIGAPCAVPPRGGGGRAAPAAAVLPDDGPRKLRMGDLACLVNCQHLAGPHPLKVSKGCVQPRKPTALMKHTPYQRGHL